MFPLFRAALAEGLVSAGDVVAARARARAEPRPTGGCSEPLVATNRSRTPQIGVVPRNRLDV